MSAIAHLPGPAWAAAHRTAVIVLAVVLLTAGVLLAVVLLTGDTTATAPPAARTFPDLPAYEDTCSDARVGAAC